MADWMRVNKIASDTDIIGCPIKFLWWNIIMGERVAVAGNWVCALRMGAHLKLVRVEQKSIYKFLSSLENKF